MKMNKRLISAVLFISMNVTYVLEAAKQAIVYTVENEEAYALLEQNKVSLDAETYAAIKELLDSSYASDIDKER